MTDALVSQTDTELDAEIVSHVEDLRRALGSAVEAAWVLGRKLAERKRRMGHGGWLPYLDKIGLPARTAQEAMALGTKYAQCAHLPATWDDARKALRAGPVEQRQEETLRAWPGLRARMGKADIQLIVYAYSRLSAFMCGSKDWPTQAEWAWVIGVERLFEREFRCPDTTRA